MISIWILNIDSWAVLSHSSPFGNDRITMCRIQSNTEREKFHGDAVGTEGRTVSVPASNTTGRHRYQTKIPVLIFDTGQHRYWDGYQTEIPILNLENTQWRKAKPIQPLLPSIPPVNTDTKPRSRFWIFAWLNHCTIYLDMGQGCYQTKCDNSDVKYLFQLFPIKE